jgi:predicted transcriptional regulator
MIHIEVDEAYAFDFLSILEIKKKNSEKDINNFTRISNSISDQIGKELFDIIIKSSYYQSLLCTNKRIYDTIDLLRSNSIELDAKVIDDANTERFKFKKQLQSEFFNSDLVESKNL